MLILVLMEKLSMSYTALGHRGKHKIVISTISLRQLRYQFQQKKRNA